jgi:hypothetical protein
MLAGVWADSVSYRREVGVRAASNRSPGADIFLRDERLLLAAGHGDRLPQAFRDLLERSFSHLTPRGFRAKSPVAAMKAMGQASR